MVIKQICRDADKKPASVIRLLRSGLFICLLCVMASCSSLAPSVTPSNMSATITPSVSHYVPTPSDNVPLSTPTSGSIAKPTDPATTVTINSNSDQGEVNLRGGPGTTYSRVGTLNVGEKVQAFGKSQGGDWIEVNFPSAPSGKAWVFSSLVTISGNELPVVDSNGSLITAATSGQTYGQTYNSMPLDSRVVKAIRIFGQQQGVNIYYVGKTDFTVVGPGLVKIVDQYNVDGFIYEIDPLTYRVVNYHISPVQPVNGRTYSEDELEKMALQFVMAQIPGIQLQDLRFNKGNKGENFFFRWSKSASGQGYFECVQVGYSLYGQLFDYIDSLPTDVIQ